MGRISREKLGVVICQRKARIHHHQEEEQAGLQMVPIHRERHKMLGLVHLHLRHRKKMANKHLRVIPNASHFSFHRWVSYLRRSVLVSW